MMFSERVLLAFSDRGVYCFMIKYSRALLVLLLIASPAQAEDLKTASITETQLTEGPVIFDTKDSIVHPLELIGETREKRKHWYSLKLGKKYYIYTVAENKFHYITTKKIPLVYDARSWGKQHPIATGGFEMVKITAGGLITAGVAAAGVRK